VLAAVEAADLPDAWVGAGVIRDLVWDTKFGSGFKPALVKDVDVLYFDPSDLSRERDASATEFLRRLCPDVTWDATNQAAVHTWYGERFGLEMAQLESIEDAIASFETANAVAARKSGGRVDVIAPRGL
jgi:uncharacterized protein